MDHFKVNPDAPSRGEDGNEYHSSYRHLHRQRLSLDCGTKDPAVSLNEKPDAPSSARWCNTDYHFSRSVLHQKLELDTKDCFKLGTRFISISTPVRNMLGVEKAPEENPLTGYSQRLKEAEDQEYKESAKKPLLLAAMKESRKPLKGNMYDKVNLEMNGCTPSINEEPLRKQLQEDVTPHRNFGSVSKGLKRKQIFEVPEPGGGYQSASQRQILGSFQCTPEWTPTANDYHEAPAIKKFRRDPQWRQPYGEPLKSTARLLTGYLHNPPEVSTPFPLWTLPVEREVKKLTQHGQKESAKNGSKLPAFTRQSRQ